MNPNIPQSKHLVLSNDGEQRGCLTTVGQQQALEFGNWLAHEYIRRHKLILPVYDENNVYTRSTITKRSIASAIGVLTVFFSEEQITESFSINIKHEEDDLWPNYEECANIRKRYLKFWINDFGDTTRSEIDIEVGLAADSKPLSSKELFDTIRCREAHQLNIPQILLDKRAKISQESLTSLCLVLGKDNIEHLRNSVGSFVHTLCNTMEELADINSHNTISLYSAHDTTVISLLLVFGIFDDKWPPFLASIIIEVYRSEDNERCIRILYNRCSIKLDGHKEYILLEHFVQIIKKYRISDWNVNCGNLNADNGM